MIRILLKGYYYVVILVYYDIKLSRILAPLILSLKIYPNKKNIYLYCQYFRDTTYIREKMYAPVVLVFKSKTKWKQTAGEQRQTDYTIVIFSDT